MKDRKEKVMKNKYGVLHRFRRWNQDKANKAQTAMTTHAYAKFKFCFCF